MILHSKRNMRTYYDLFEQLYSKYGKPLYVVAYRIVQNRQMAEDCVHETFVKFQRYLSKNNEYNNEDNLESYAGLLYTICHNAAVDMCRNRTPLNQDADYIEHVSFDDIDVVSNPSELLVNRETTRKIYEAIGKLDAKYRNVFLMRNFYGCSREDIACMLDISTETVKKRLVRARKMIIAQLEEEGYHEN
ncbi:MAG: sigma-70 family RNA polymerase sigma factor [Clostridia bacterium]|nr:sigma-70 family RNA polymerase sigma factor [Clostridia bacterium]